MTFLGRLKLLIKNFIFFIETSERQGIPDEWINDACMLSLTSLTCRMIVKVNLKIISQLLLTQRKSYINKKNHQHVSQYILNACSNITETLKKYVESGPCKT